MAEYLFVALGVCPGQLLYPDFSLDFVVQKNKNTNDEDLTLLFSYLQTR